MNNLKYRTLLLSNDRNLNIKAMAHEVQSLSRETVGALNQLLQSVGGKESLEMNRIYHSDEKFRQKMDIKEKTKNIAANLDIEIPKELTGKKNCKKRRRYRMAVAKSMVTDTKHQDMQSMEMDSNPDISQHAPLSLSVSIDRTSHSNTALLIFFFRTPRYIPVQLNQTYRHRRLYMIPTTIQVYKKIPHYL